MKTYRVKEIFRTLQGEGVHAGRVAIFLRFVGCNLWSGHEKDRQRDADRNDVECPRFCDTDFVGGTPMTGYEIKQRVEALRQAGDELLVITGGEPLLQLDLELTTVLVGAIRASPGPHGWQRPGTGPGLALETNGTVELDSNIGVMLQHITVSPKVPAHLLRVTRGDELRVPYPGLDPLQYDCPWLEFKQLFVSAIGDSGLASRARLEEAARFCLANPRWRLSVQLHKVIGLP